MERCLRCSRQLLVPIDTTSPNDIFIRCPNCNTLNRFSPPFNRMPAPPRIGGRYPYRAAAYNKPLAVRPLMPLASPFGRKKAVVCGVSHKGTKHNINGSINDAMSIKYFLIEDMGFPPESIVTLTEEERSPMRIPTKANMIMAMKWLVQDCQRGDSLVFYYSGHGSKEPDTDMDEISGFDQTLCPLDFEIRGKLIDDEINAILVRPLPNGTTLHAIIDSCFSGSVLDLPFVCKINRKGNFIWEDERISPTYKGTSGGLALSFSACRDHQISLTTNVLTGNPTGALTHSFIKAVRNEPGLTYARLLIGTHNAIIRATSGRVQVNAPVASLAQEPQLSFSAKFDIYTKKFIL